VEQIITPCPRTEVFPDVELLGACTCHCLSVHSSSAVLAKETDEKKSKKLAPPFQWFSI
jgi:hypothetical protein